MSKINFYLKNYFQSSDLEYEEVDSDNLYSQIIDNVIKTRAYPFSKKELLEYLTTDEFLNSMYLNSSEKEFQMELVQKIKMDKKNKINFKRLLELIPVEKKIEEIQVEKQRRHQSYTFLDYKLSKFTYFDFFSSDCFEIAKYSKYLTQLSTEKKVRLEHLFLTFFVSNLFNNQKRELEVGKLLKEFQFDKNFLSLLNSNFKIFQDKRIESEQPIFEQLKTILNSSFNQVIGFIKKFEFEKTNQKIFVILDKLTNFEQIKIEDLGVRDFFFNQKISYSSDVHQIFEKSSENAFNRFKTPIITPEILLITLMEEKNFPVAKLIKEKLENGKSDPKEGKTNWYLFRYKLLKRLYYQEINLRDQVKRNQHLFAYLLKLELSEVDFEKLIEKKLLSEAVALFRNFLIINLLKSDFFDSFEEDTYDSILMSPKRSYSI